MVWNGIEPDRSPDVIVTVTDDDDVVQAINFARKNGLKVVVHGGGHTWCGLALRNGGMTIDLSRLTKSKIDKDSAKAIIQPIISNRDAARRLGEHGLAFPLGHCLLAGILYAGSGVGLSLLLAVRAMRPGRTRIVRPRGADVIWLLGAIAFGGAIGPYLLMDGLQMTDSASASLILNLEGVFTALLAWLRLRRTLTAELPSAWH